MIVLYCDDFPSSYADKPGQHQLAWALAYMALGILTGEDPEMFKDRIGYLDRGKPVVYERGLCSAPEADRPAVCADLCVNVSHSPTCVAAAADRSAVGVDCERRFDWKEPLAKRVCTPHEMELLECADESLKKDLLNRVWSRKESLLKKTGEGIRKDLRKVETMDAQADEMFCEMQNERFTLCVCGSDMNAQIKRIPFDELSKMMHSSNKM